MALSKINRTSLDTGIDDNSDATAITIDSSENVGVGTTSPTRLLTVENSSGNSNLCVKSANTGVSQVMFGDSDSDVIGNIAYNHTSNYMYSEVNGSERMRIESDGDFLFMASSDVTSSVAGISFTNTTHPAINVSGGSDTNSRHRMTFINGNGTVGTIATSGTSTSYNTSSDHRLKENVTADWDATTRLKQLNPVRFNFIADADTTVDGFLAHEVSSVIPEAISGEKDAVDENGNPVYQGIDQSKLVPVLTKALQEAITKIEQLETRIQTLENA